MSVQMFKNQMKTLSEGYGIKGNVDRKSFWNNLRLFADFCQSFLIFYFLIKFNCVKMIVKGIL